MSKILKRMGLFTLMGMMVMLLAACGEKQSSASNKGYDNSISKGLDAVAEDKMDKAVTYFTNALDQKPKDKKATAYLKQAKAYVDTNKQLNDGEPEQAVKTVTDGTNVKHGAKSIEDKLDTLLKTATADSKEYQQLDKDISAQLKFTTPSQDVVKQAQSIDWAKKPYLKKLKAKVDELIKKAKAQADKANAASSSQANDAKIHAEAEDLRQGIVSSMGENSGYTMAGLETVPDKVIVDLSHQGESQGLDIGWLGEELARRYPNTKSAQSSANESEGNLSAQDIQQANDFKDYLVRQGVNADDLKQIPTSTIVNAMNSSATVTDGIRKLYSQYPNVRGLSMLTTGN